MVDSAAHPTLVGPQILPGQTQLVTGKWQGPHHGIAQRGRGHVIQVSQHIRAVGVAQELRHVSLEVAHQAWEGKEARQRTGGRVEARQRLAQGVERMVVMCRYM